MLVVGLTGGIASGKSTVSNILSEKYNIPLIDSDKLARIVVEPGHPTHAKIIKAFGEEILQPGDEAPTKRPLDRKKLGAVVFSDPEKRKQLNGITHPSVRIEMVKRLVKFWITGKRIVVVDTPLLIEVGLWRYVGSVVVVYVSEAVQFRRLVQRDAPNANGAEKEQAEQDARNRIQSQMNLKDKVPYADFVIDNSGDRLDLDSQIAEMIRGWNKRTKWSWIIEWLIPPIGILSALYALWQQRRKAKKRGLGKKQD